MKQDLLCTKQQSRAEEEKGGRERERADGKSEGVGRRAEGAKKEEEYVVGRECVCVCVK